MATANLEERFTYHAPPNEDVRTAHRIVREACLEAALGLDDLLPECREKSLALTKLEEAMFWGNAAIARNHEQFIDGAPNPVPQAPNA